MVTTSVAKNDLKIAHILTLCLFPLEMGILAIVPARLAPYGELIRIQKPVGFIYLYTSCASGTLMVECLADSITPASRLIATNIVLFISSIAFRSAACSWNDTVDQEIDRMVTRTRLRPIARGALSSQDAHSCTAVFLMASLCLQSQLPIGHDQAGAALCVYYSTPFIAAAGAYPFLKRFTHYPQLLLGFMQS